MQENPTRNRLKSKTAAHRGDGPLAAGAVKLLLDGQQRITSPYGVVRGEPPKFFDGNAHSTSIGYYARRVWLDPELAKKPMQRLECCSCRTSEPVAKSITARLPNRAVARESGAEPDPANARNHQNTIARAADNPAHGCAPA
ncbi:MAG: hypothetical protein RKO24_07090, partial [Candidatus Competibacter sp.]|nr:hypothetical protein [Candidatus Competibacter sp.]